MCVFAGYSWPLEGSDELQTTPTVVELDVALFHDMFVLYHQTTKKRTFFSFASRIFKLAAAAPRWKVEGLREEQQRELRGCNNRSSNKSSGRLVVVGGVCGRAASQTHISRFSLEVYTTILPEPFSVRRR